jgi:pimeloyl-ACP methyl ester carboxylesterase
MKATMPNPLLRRLAWAPIAALSILLLGATPPQPLVLAQDGFFFVGGQYVKTPSGDVMDGQMYVHALIPWKVTHKYGIVFITGRNSTGVTFEGTPDGREGWAQFFVRRGYRVYVTDQPARGRSVYHPDLDGKLAGGSSGTAQSAERTKTDQQHLDSTSPQSKLHTQWPGKGREGDPVFDQFYAAQVESVLTQTDWTEQHMRSAGAALLDRVGPSILITHSQGGALGWVVADARPKLVKAIIAVEPALSPTVKITSSEPPFYGITQSPITYDPPVTDPQQIVHDPQTVPDRPEVLPCWLQAPPVRTLPTLKGIAILVVASQASAQSGDHYCVSRYLTQAGVRNEYVALASVGITGNAHMMMLEKNSDVIAAYFARWLARRHL